ncbi:prepilin-type N-terminal cleavage/methylation domain-containing protein [Vibrio sp. JC009]|uniref:type II secretion system protein n=1 Tax=Vibrio sp. JC009 TaxID=2912314 RepID=UPI0023B100AA|nr:prepilin-type N-terminal cleavage/methylation domain-containing protein [Vibrio sp. JC009]WED21544.1 prepilin-type N-terminal cleavage/methylation domain-containing protein [Vibrio sp. JC009]
MRAANGVVMRKNIDQSPGFTLIEMVVVIVIIGLLAVTALPKFLDVADEAQKSSIKAVSGSFATAVLSVRAQWEAEARPVNSAGGNSVNYDGTDFLLTSSDNTGFRDGYPIALDESGASASVATDITCKDLMEELLQSSLSVNVEGSTSGDDNYSAEAIGSSECRYTQLESSDEYYFSYDITAGRVSVSLE